MRVNKDFKALEDELIEKREKLMTNFHKGAEDIEAIDHVLNCLKVILSGAKFIDIEEGRPELFFEFHTAIFDYLDYLDAESTVQKDYILKNFDRILFAAEGCFKRHGGETFEPQPKAGSARLRFALCAANINYRQNNFVSGLQVISKIRYLLDSEDVKQYRDEITPYLEAQLCFIEGKIHVRLTNYERAQELFAKAVIAYEEWELWKNENRSDFRNFVTYKICVTEAFSAYAYILQGKLGKVLRDVFTIERLLEYSEHRKTRNFVKIIGARALRLTGYGNSDKLFSALKILNATRETLDQASNYTELDKKLVSETGIRFFQHNRHNLMRLFQEGLVYFYLHTSDPERNNTDPIPGRETRDYLVALNEVICEIRKINEDESKSKSRYWTVRANLLQIYLFLCRKEMGAAIELAERNLETDVEDLVARIESLVACAECYIAYIRSKGVPFNQINDLEKWLRAIDRNIKRCLDIADEVIGAKYQSVPPIFGRVYLLQAEARAIEGKQRAAEEAWEKWANISAEIENTRWHNIAARVLDEINLDRFVYFFKGNFKVDIVQTRLEEWLYRHIKAKFDTDIERINALDISREKFYRWKKLYDVDNN